MDIVKHLMAGELYQYRKYGAKKETQSRDSTRHYFRCKVDDCPSRKIIEVNADGSYTVEDRGAHNHAPDAAPSATVPSKRSSEEVERPAVPEEQSLTRSKRASAQNVSNVIRLVKTSSQQMLASDQQASPRLASPRSAVHSLDPGGSPRAMTAVPSHMHYQRSPPYVGEEIGIPIKREPTPAARAMTPAHHGASPQRSFTPRYASPEARAYTPVVDAVPVEPPRAQAGAMALATAAVGPVTAGEPIPGAVHIAHEIPGQKPPVQAPIQVPLHHGPVGPPMSQAPPIQNVAVGVPAPVMAGPPRVVTTPEPAPATPASAAGTCNYPGHEGVPVNDSRVLVNEWRAEEGVLGLIFTGSEKEYADAYCWRKYGKKSIKGHVMPRFYWRCTHKQCDIKRHTQATEDGRTEVRYYGRHCHSPPPLKTSRGRARASSVAAVTGAGISATAHAPSSPRSGAVATSSGASPLGNTFGGAQGAGPGPADGADSQQAPGAGARSRFMRTARLRAPTTRMLLHSDDEEDFEQPPRQRQRRGDADGAGGAAANVVPPNLSRCPLYFLACVAANQAR